MHVFTVKAISDNATVATRYGKEISEPRNIAYSVTEHDWRHMQVYASELAGPASLIYGAALPALLCLAYDHGQRPSTIGVPKLGKVQY
jgi:hypothetical protein